jgi:hypothetical protein
MAESSQFQSTRGTVLATFGQNGTFSSAVDLGGGWLIGCYSDNFPGAAGSLIFRSSWNPSGTGYPVQSWDGTVLKTLAFGSGTFYSIGAAPMVTAPMQYIRVQIGTAGTAGVAAGGTIVLITEA